MNVIINKNFKYNNRTITGYVKSNYIMVHKDYLNDSESTIIEDDKGYRYKRDLSCNFEFFFSFVKI